MALCKNSPEFSKDWVSHYADQWWTASGGSFAGKDGGVIGDGACMDCCNTGLFASLADLTTLDISVARSMFEKYVKKTFFVVEVLRDLSRAVLLGRIVAICFAAVEAPLRSTSNPMRSSSTQVLGQGFVVDLGSPRRWTARTDGLRFKCLVTNRIYCVTQDLVFPGGLGWLVTAKLPLLARASSPRTLKRQWKSAKHNSVRANLCQGWPHLVRISLASCSPHSIEGIEETSSKNVLAMDEVS